MLGDPSWISCKELDELLELCNQEFLRRSSGLFSLDHLKEQFFPTEEVLEEKLGKVLEEKLGTLFI